MLTRTRKDEKEEGGQGEWTKKGTGSKRRGEGEGKKERGRERTAKKPANTKCC